MPGKSTKNINIYPQAFNLIDFVIKGNHHIVLYIKASRNLNYAGIKIMILVLGHFSSVFSLSLKLGWHLTPLCYKIKLMLFLTYLFKYSFINSFKMVWGSPHRKAKCYHCHCGVIKPHPALYCLYQTQLYLFWRKKNV